LKLTHHTARRKLPDSITECMRYVRNIDCMSIKKL
jgi:hypothetical protein